jgi:hypothetical protein
MFVAPTLAVYNAGAIAAISDAVNISAATSRAKSAGFPRRVTIQPLLEML